MAKGIRQLGLTTVRDIKVDGLGFFEAPITTIDGVAYTLDSFERTFVFDGHALPKVGATLTPAPRTLDPRPHFALANGTLGGALIEPRAFRPESLDAQLDRATRDALANPRHLRRDADLGRLWGSSIFTWYEWDFGGREGVSAFVKRHAPEALRAEIATKADPVVDLTIPWDWNFNMVPHKPTKPSGGKPASGASSDSSGTEKTRTP
jgi:hypothetical protein